MRLWFASPHRFETFFWALAQPDATTMQYNEPFSIFENARMVDWSIGASLASHRVIILQLGSPAFSQIERSVVRFCSPTHYYSSWNTILY
jgi:hypothetical protein